MIQCLYLQNLHFLETGGAVPYLVQLYASPLVNGPRSVTMANIDGERWTVCKGSRHGRPDETTARLAAVTLNSIVHEHARRVYDAAGQGARGGCILTVALEPVWEGAPGRGATERASSQLVLNACGKS